MIAGQDILRAVNFFKVFGFVVALLPVLLLLYELTKIETKYAIPLALAIQLYGIRYLQTVSDGTIFNIFSFAMYILTIQLLLRRHFFYAGVTSGLALIHYYGIVYTATLIPSIFFIKAVKQFVPGLIIGLMPSIHKWLYLALLAFQHGATIAGVSELPKWTLQNYLSYAFTPDIYWGDAAFYTYIATAIILIMNRQFNRLSLLLSITPGMYIVTTLVLPITVISPSVITTTLTFRMYRLLPFVLILLIILLLRTRGYRRYDGLITLLLTSALLVGATTNLTAVPQGSHRIDHNAFNALLSLKPEICEGGVIATGGTAEYIEIICRDVVVLNPPSLLATISLKDPKAVLIRQILAQVENGTLQGYSWFVLQEPIAGQWYHPEIKSFVQRLKEKIFVFGEVKYIIYNQGVPVYIIRLR